MEAVFSELETLSYLRPKTRKILPPEIEEVDSLLKLKNQIRLWNPTSCPCRICKTYIHDVGLPDIHDVGFI